MSKSLNEEILSVVQNQQQIDEATFAEIARGAAQTAAGRVAAAGLLANPVGGVQTIRGTPGTMITIPQGSMDVAGSATLPTTHSVSTQPFPGTPAIAAHTPVHHGVLEFTADAHPQHGTPVIKDGKIKPGNETFRVNTQTGETHRAGSGVNQWIPVAHSSYTPPTRDQIEQRAVPGSATHTQIQKLKQMELAGSQPGTAEIPGTPSRTLPVFGTKDVKTITSVPAPDAQIFSPGLPTRTGLLPRADEYIDTSKLGIPSYQTKETLEKERLLRTTEIVPRSERTAPPQETVPQRSGPSTSDTIRRNAANRDSSGRLRGSTPTPAPAPAPIPPAPAPALVRAFEPGKVRYGSKGRIADVIGGVPIYSKPKEGPLVPGPGPRIIVRSHYEQEGDNMLSEKYKDKEEEKKLTPHEKARKKKIASALEKNPKFKKRFGPRADEVRSRIANKMAQKNESYNPYKGLLYSLLETNEKGKIDDPHDPKNFGLNIDKIKAENPTAFVSHGDIVDNSDIIHFHKGYLESAIKQGDARETERHTKVLKRVMPHDEVDALVKEFNAKHGR